MLTDTRWNRHKILFFWSLACLAKDNNFWLYPFRKREIAFYYVLIAFTKGVLVTVSYAYLIHVCKFPERRVWTKWYVYFHISDEIVTGFYHGCVSLHTLQK